MPVIADIDADARERRVETWITKITRPEIKFFPEAGIDVRNVVLAILAEILAVVFDHPEVLFDVSSFDLFDRSVGRPRIFRLNQSAFNCSWHISSRVSGFKYFRFCSWSAVALASSTGNKFHPRPRTLRTRRNYRV